MMELIKNIIPESENTWKDKFFLTFDIDWCDDNVLKNTIQIIEDKDVKATFFVTHETKLLKRLRENPKIELGIHPNFNFLLNGDFRYGKNYKEVIDYFIKIVPEAVSARSHSLTVNSLILDYYSKAGIKYECSYLLSHLFDLKPYYYEVTNIIRCPHIFEDDVYYSKDNNYFNDIFVQNHGIKIFDFHPVHVFLNTENQKRYEYFKSLTEAGKEYFNENIINNKVPGTLDLLKALLTKN